MKPVAKKRFPPQTQSITWNNLTWVDISCPTNAETDALARSYNFHPLALEDSISRGQLSKIDDYGNYLVLVLHMPVSVPETQLIKSAWMVVFIGSDYIVTLHDEFKILSDLFTSCRTKEMQLEYFSDRSGYLVYHIIDHLVESCFPILNTFLTRMDGIEESVFEEASDDTVAISILRRDLITLRRIIWPSRSVIADLKTRIRPFTSENLDMYFDDLMDHINKIWDNLEEAKEVVEVFKDSDFVLVTNRINRIVQTLTLISSIILPFLVVSSLYGMNIGLPGGINGNNWVTFVVLLGIMFIISGTMLYFFRRRRWI